MTLSSGSPSLRGVGGLTMPSGCLSEGDTALTSWSPHLRGDRASTPRSPNLRVEALWVLGAQSAL